MRYGTEQQELEYEYKGVKHIAHLSIVCPPGKPDCYWFRSKQGFPYYLNKVEGVWLLNGNNPLESSPKVEVLKALAKALDGRFERV